jgi:hypothetical protein
MSFLIIALILVVPLYSCSFYISAAGMRIYPSPLVGEGRGRVRLPRALPIIPSHRGRGKVESFMI